MSEQKTVVYVGSFAFPYGGAAARRVLGNAKSLRDAGYKVIIGTGQPENSKNPKFQEFEGFEVYTLDERPDYKRSALKYFKYLNIGWKTIHWLDAMEEKPAVVLLYGGYTPYFLKLLPWCKKHNIPLVFDAVEWYQPKNKVFGYLSPIHLNYEWAMRKLSVKGKNIISISTFLDRHYKSKNCNSIIVPPTIDTNDFEPNVDISLNKRLSIAYTGTPGYKDLFDNYLEAIIRTDPLGEKIYLRVAGVTNEQMLQYPALRTRNYTTIPPCIENVGHVHHSNAINLVRTSDFSVLLRKINRVSTAGFPTKVVESLTAGTPVICNLTSDLANYIHDDIEGIICKDYHVDTLIAALKKAMNKSKEERAMMRVNARKQAENSFDYRKYVHLFSEFIGGLIAKEKSTII